MSEPAEFYGSVQIVPLSDPATDPLMTVRMEPPDTWARRYDGATRRVSKQHAGDRGWREVGREVGRWYSDADVEDWLVQHPLVWGVAMNRLAGKAVPPPASALAAELVGDMGPEAFKGEKS